jgi:hypothetical protein
VARLEVTVSPGARTSEVVGRHGSGWKARIAAPPERGKANRALEELLADVLGVPRDRVAVVAGRTARRKVVEVEGLEAPELVRRLEAAITAG